MDDDELATCPYNPCHRIKKSRFQHHIVKCEKTSPKLVICPFNATHRFPEKMIHKHCLMCPNRPVNPPRPKLGKMESIGATTAPKPILQKEYLPATDPENDYWDD